MFEVVVVKIFGVFFVRFMVNGFYILLMLGNNVSFV